MGLPDSCSPVGGASMGLGRMRAWVWIPLDLLLGFLGKFLPL